MLRRFRDAIGIFFPSPPPASRPLGPLPESVKELARNRPPFGQPRTPSPWPLVNAEGKTWAQARREREAQVSR